MRKFLIASGVIVGLMVVACLAAIISTLMPQEPRAAGPLPNSNIVFHPENYNTTLGFIDADGENHTTLEVMTEYNLYHLTTWGLDGSYLTARLIPNINPNGGYPAVITSDGTVHLCDEDQFYGQGRITGLDNHRVVVALHDIEQVVILNMETCQVETVLYSSQNGGIL